jgi:hypothetical protein
LGWDVRYWRKADIVLHMNAVSLAVPETANLSLAPSMARSRALQSLTFSRLIVSNAFRLAMAVYVSF